MKKFIFSIAMVCCLSLGVGAAFAAGPANQGEGYRQELSPRQLEQPHKIFDDNYVSMDTARSNQLSQQGLPEDYYGRGPRAGRYYDDGRIWHHGRGHGHWGGRPYGCGGC